MPGEQASHTSMIENFFGFPEGIGGAELARMAGRQAEKFVRLDRLMDGRMIRSRFSTNLQKNRMQVHRWHAWAAVFETGICGIDSSSATVDLALPTSYAPPHSFIRRTPMTHAALSESIFCAFPARSYLEKYYSSVEPENAAFVRSITEYLWPRTEATDTVIEVAGGPCLYSLMSLMASRGQPFDHLTFTDIGWKNLREVECWLQGHPSQFDCDPLLRWLSEEVGVDPDTVARLLRASTWELARVDWRKPVPQAWRHSYDVVSCHFFAESATDDETELVAFLEKLGDLGRPGATLMTSFVCRSADYTVQQRDLPAFAVDETTIFEYLERAGLELEDIEVRSVPSEDPASHSGYKGLLFAAGRLPGRSRARRPQPMSTGVPVGTRL